MTTSHYIRTRFFSSRFTCFFLLSASLAFPVAAQAENMEDKIREAVVAELTRKQQQAYDEALENLENKAVADNPEAQHSQLKQLLKFTVAKAVTDYDQEVEHHSDESGQPVPSKIENKSSDRLAASTKASIDAVVSEQAAEAASAAKSTEKSIQVAMLDQAENKVEIAKDRVSKPEPVEKKQVPNTPMVVATKEDKPKIASVKVEKTVSRTAEQPVSITPSSSQKTTDKWMYLGRYKDGAWQERTLQIGNVLPDEGKQYRISQPVNVRDGLPAKDQMPKVVDFLGENTQVTLVKLKKSGKDGYYWAQISR